MPRLLPYSEWKALLSAARIPCAAMGLTKDKEECLRIGRDLGFPLAAKLLSPDILHKTDQGAVILGIADERSLADACDRLIAICQGKAFDGILIQKMVKGKEVIIGLKRDPTFGPVVMFGLGGIFVEVLKDVSFRLPPFDEREALAMILETRGSRILQGVRGEPPVNIAALQKILVNLGKLALSRKDIVELDFNPVLVDQKQALVVDARILAT
ncbi:MAG: acetate--CoA ligase family protein [Nanoarchaeota archaeon]